MKASQLVAELQRLIAEHGDLPAYFVTDDGGGRVDVTYVSTELMPRCLEFDEHQAVVLA